MAVSGHKKDGRQMLGKLGVIHISAVFLLRIKKFSSDSMSSAVFCFFFFFYWNKGL